MPNVKTPTAITHKAQIIERLAQGHLVRDIANDLGISRQVITRYLADDPDYQAAFQIALESRLDDRESELEQASDQLSLARARELLSHARWRAERLNPSRYGQRPTVAIQVNNGASMTDADLERIARRTVEGGE